VSDDDVVRDAREEVLTQLRAGGDAEQFLATLLSKHETISGSIREGMQIWSAALALLLANLHCAHTAAGSTYPFEDMYSDCNDAIKRRTKALFDRHLQALSEDETEREEVQHGEARPSAQAPPS
jgi:hypothetical protein